MNKIKIIADSNCDVPRDLAQELSIEIIPFVITVDGVDYYENQSFTPLEYYKILENAQELPVTSQISPVTFLTYFHQAYEEGFEDVICVTITSEGSGTYNNAILAQAMFVEEKLGTGHPFHIHIVDSKNYSISYGYGVILGAKAIQNGQQVDEVLQIINHWFDNLETYFTVFNLKYVQKSGRIGSVTQVLGDFLSLRPVMSNLNGIFHVDKKVRGNVAAVKELAAIFQNRKMEQTDYVVLRGDSDVEALRLAELTTEIAGYPPVDIFFGGASLTTNTGPQITGIGFMAKDLSRKK